MVWHSAARVFAGLAGVSGAEAEEPALELLARWQHEWRVTAELEAQHALETGVANSMESGEIDPGRAGAFLDCDNGDLFWQRFRDAFSRTGPLSPETGSMAYVKWKAWEDFVDGMEEAGGFDGRVVVPLAGEWHADGSGYFTQVREKRDWVTALQKSQWQAVFGKPPAWSSDNLVGFMQCPVGFALVQYVIFLVHKMRSNLPEDAARLNLESMLFAFVSILDSHFDHSESSNWNVSSFDLAVNLNLEDPKFYPRYADFIADHAPPELRLRSWQEDWPGHRMVQSRRLEERILRTALVGEHGPSNLDNLASASAAVSSSGVRLEAGHFFTYMWQLRGLADSGSLRSSLRITWDAFWGQPLTESAGRDKSAQPSWTISGAVWALREFARRDVFLRSSDLVICSEPLWLCVLLHSALEARQRIQLTRASAAGRVMCLLVDFDQVFGLQEVDAFWELVPAFKQTELLSATSRITAEMLDWQAGIRAPYVPCLSLHIDTRYQPSKPKLLFFRSSLPGGAPFLRVLRLIEAEMRQQLVDIMMKPMSFAEIASFRAVAMLPHIPNALRLADVYAMAVPLFLPSEPLIHKFVWPDDPLPLLSKARPPRMAEPKPSAGSSRPSPLDFQIAGRRFYQFRWERHYWLQYTEWWLRPHLLHFSSARDLLEKATISDEALLRISDAMRSHQAQLQMDALDYWQTALAAALG
ncbi:unnamed protein product [Effrenium voratum]|uniref:Uncharacterized protein n=2 Tax=Effrenium voratum TaxID=2562239 RepID=A0AA36NCI3_9DINO|nr:unnamed protein product [Effrenium voratum]CAJ1426228.1 unnamed protein product [Effrenium voratum]